MKLIVFFFLISLGYNAFSQDTARGKNVPEKKNGYIIFPYDASKPVFKAIFSEENVVKADLNKDEIEQVDVLLKKCIDNFNLNQEFEYNRMLEVDSSTSKSEFFINLATYQKQFVPVINQAKQKEVWVNAFCYMKGSDKWQKELIKEEDGGKCFFNVKINLASKNFYNFSVNSQ